MQASLPAGCQVLLAWTFYGAALQAAAFTPCYETAENNILNCTTCANSIMVVPALNLIMSEQVEGAST